MGDFRHKDFSESSRPESLLSLSSTFLHVLSSLAPKTYAEVKKLFDLRQVMTSLAFHFSSVPYRSDTISISPAPLPSSHVSWEK